MKNIQNDNDLVVVDDCEMDLMMMKRYLEMSNLTNPYLPFNTGEGFITHMNNVSSKKAPMPALVFLDINTPKMNGFEILEKIRSDESFVEFPTVIFLTTSQDPQDLARCKALNTGMQEKFDNMADGVQYLNSLIPSAG